MTHRPSISKLYVSPSYTSLASQTTLTEETTIPPSKQSSSEDNENQPTSSSFSPHTPPIITSSFNNIDNNNNDLDDNGDDDDDDPQITPTRYNIRKRPFEQKAPLPTSLPSPSSSRYNTKDINHNKNNVAVTRNDLSIKKTTELFNKTIDKITIPIRNDLPIAAAVETKVMGAHHHRHRSLVHHYSPLTYVPNNHRLNNTKESYHHYHTKERLEDNGNHMDESMDEKDQIKKPTTVIPPTAFTTAASTSIPMSPISTTTKDNRCSIASTAIGEEDARELLQQHQHNSRMKKERIIVLLGDCLLKSGCPGHRAEEALQHSSNILGLNNATFSLLPETVLVTFTSIHGGSKHQQSLMIKSPASLDMGKIGEVQRIMNQCLLQYYTTVDDNDIVDDATLESHPHHHHPDDKDPILDQCIQSLQHVSNSPPTWGFLGTVFSFFASSFTACAMLFNGSWMDCVMSGALGIIVSMLFVLASYRPIYGRVFEISSCVFVSALAQALQNYCCFTSVAVSGVLILLPGYAMTMAVMELSARRVTTGTIRLIYAVFYAFLLAYGFQIGSRAYTSIAEAIHGPMEVEHADDLCGQDPISQWYYIPLLPLLSISIGISYGSSVRQWVAQLGGTVIGFCLSYFMSKVVPDPPIVESTAAFAVGLYSHFVLKLTGEPPLISMAVGITLLVPGSIGVKGAYTLLHQEDTNQTLFPIKMLTVALGLAAGLFASAMIVYPAGKKRTLLLSL